MSDLLIKAEHVSKKFCRSLKRSLWYGMKDVTHSLNPWARSQQMNASGEIRDKVELRPDEFWALQDISFEVRRGECLGLIGHNGAGKSTLLKILNGLIRPDGGRITMRGRVGALIELSAGFNPILSGRENIYTQAALLGFSASEVRARFDDIVAFAELEQFIDMPLQNYSSGMAVRLGFAVTSQMEPDILLVDEVLAVGDVGFRTKCLARMGELLNKTASIFVSHSMPQVARVSTDFLHLDHGKTRVHTGDISDAMDSYYGTFSQGGIIRGGSGDVKVTSVRAKSGNHIVTEFQPLSLSYGEDIEIWLECEFSSQCHTATIQLLVWNQELTPIMDIVGEDMLRVPICPDEQRRTHVYARIPRTCFNAGNYSISITVLSPDGFTTFCTVDRAVELKVDGNHGSACPFIVCAEWRSGRAADNFVH
ncbi:MAG: polysaccharide ABC transporter ATP-binding protein [Planctomycetaceae bacterium]